MKWALILLMPAASFSYRVRSDATITRLIAHMSWWNTQQIFTQILKLDWFPFVQNVSLELFVHRVSFHVSVTFAKSYQNPPSQD